MHTERKGVGEGGVEEKERKKEKKKKAVWVPVLA